MITFVTIVIFLIVIGFIMDKEVKRQSEEAKKYRDDKLELLKKIAENTDTLKQIISESLTI